MPRFSYTARDASGQSVSATLDAPTRRDALRMLSARGVRVLSVEEQAENVRPARDGAAAKTKPPAKVAAARLRRERTAVVLRRKERLSFLQALHDLTSSGLSAGESVRLLSHRIKEPALRALCGGLWERIGEGAPLSQAMAAFPQVFDSSTLNLIQAGEATGSLNETLSRLIAHLHEQRELRRQLASALAYPVFMMFVAGGVILFFMFFLLPRLQTLLSSLGGELPLSTKILVGAANFSLHYGIFVIAAAIFAGISFWRWRATEPGRAKSDAWFLKLPLVGAFITSQTVLAISQTLSVLLENGITTAEALKMTERQIANRVQRSAFGAAITRVLEGEALSLALARTNVFPDLVLDRLAVGENTGNVVPSLKDIAKNYRANITVQLNVFTRVIASAVLLAVFVFVGFIAFAIVSAVFQASASFKA
ncbi:type II secretion system F family protein [Horticoccus luteus]|uniref:Type II secretion system F family protein n=1 Tax=Horticoccus luteus TaxID=2862869 RepID=A0A8F9TSN7_9BACT|nr:type II secretion system F family protein [Horticoccus luteus]QYM78331.1 type II secretion system F family protein [Horticoccus luteus]